jgi:hypothetical protein
MRGHHVKNAAVTLCVLLLLLLALPAVLGRRYSFSVTAQREWICEAVQQLAQASPPPAEPEHNEGDAWWKLPGYLLFSNGWATYKINTFHDGNKVGDAAVLRTSDGVFYLTHTHFCTGILELMQPFPGAEESNPRPADATDFFQNYGRLQGWNLFSTDNRLWCVINCSGEGDMRARKKSFWVWISSGEGSNRTTLLDRRYTVNGAYVSWTSHWLSNDCLAIHLYDYGPYNSPRLYPDSLQSNHIMSLNFGRDKPTGQFVEQK